VPESEMFGRVITVVLKSGPGATVKDRRVPVVAAVRGGAVGRHESLDPRPVQGKPGRLGSVSV